MDTAHDQTHVVRTGLLLEPVSVEFIVAAGWACSNSRGELLQMDRWQPDAVSQSLREIGLIDRYRHSLGKIFAAKERKILTYCPLKKALIYMKSRAPLLNGRSMWLDGHSYCPRESEFTLCPNGAMGPVWARIL
jgi:hypothetical protein